VLTLAADQVRPAPEFGPACDTRYLLGLAAVDQRMLILVDIERLMRSPDMALMEEAA
jgi:purine-binding chemotaxis protein CheW